MEPWSGDHGEAIAIVADGKESSFQLRNSGLTPIPKFKTARPVLTPFGILSYRQKDNQSGGTGRCISKVARFSANIECGQIFEAGTVHACPMDWLPTPDETLGRGGSYLWRLRGYESQGNSGRRVAILYGGAIFACRRCYRLAYPSQRENAISRATQRADKIRARMGWEPGIQNGHGQKPKGARLRTFEMLTAEHESFAGSALGEIERRFGVMP
jgi:hypothetical protein